MDEESYLHIDRETFDASNARYKKTTEDKLRNSGLIVLAGYRVQVKVQYYALVLCHGDKEEVKLYRGVHNIRQIVICIDNGYISFGAIKWCIDENITIIMIDWSGCLVQVLTPKHPCTARLIWQQYNATQSEIGVSICTELVRRKAQAQLSTLALYPHLPKQMGAVEIIEREMANLPAASTITRVRAIEAVVSRAYFSVFTGLPIRWQKSVAKTLPPHWLTITNRISPLAKDHGAWHAVNPFHSALNFAYALLEGQILQSVMMTGLEPTCGYLHTFHGDRVVNSLVHDLQEPFRPAVDAKVLSLFEKTTFRKGDFYQLLSGECRLNEQLRRYILASCRVEQNCIDDLVQHLTILLAP